MSEINLGNCFNPVKSNTGIYLILLITLVPTLTAFAGMNVSNYLHQDDYTNGYDIGFENGTIIGYDEGYLNATNDLADNITDAYDDGYADGLEDGFTPYSTITLRFASNFVYKVEQADSSYINYYLSPSNVSIGNNRILTEDNLLYDDKNFTDYMNGGNGEFDLPIITTLYVENFTILGFYIRVFENQEQRELNSHSYSFNVLDTDGFGYTNGYGNYYIDILEIKDDYTSSSEDTLTFMFNDHEFTVLNYK